jgi:Domain of unknown function (DUF1996)
MLSGVWIVTRAPVLLESILSLTLEWYLTTLMRSMVVTVSHWVYFLYDPRIRKRSLLSTDMRTKSSAIYPRLFELRVLLCSYSDICYSTCFILAGTLLMLALDFGFTTTYDDLMNSECTSCLVTQDKSAYW